MENTSLEQHVQPVPRHRRAPPQPQRFAREKLKRTLQETLDSRRTQGRVHKVGRISRSAPDVHVRPYLRNRYPSRDRRKFPIKKERRQRIFPLLIETRITEDGSFRRPRDRQFE